MRMARSRLMLAAIWTLGKVLSCSLPGGGRWLAVTSDSNRGVKDQLLGPFERLSMRGLTACFAERKIVYRSQLANFAALEMLRC